MLIKDVQSSLALVDSHLSGYLHALRISTDIHIQVQSRWPWVTEVVLPYPNSLLDRLVLFVRTLRFCIPKEVKDRFFQRSIESLQIYKNAIKYQLLAHKPVYLDREEKILSNEKFLCELEDLERILLHKGEITSKQKGSLREWGGVLVDLHSSIRLDAILDFNKNPNTLLNSIKMIKKHMQKRQQKIPYLIKKAISEQLDFFAQERLKTKENAIESPLSKRVQLFSYFVSEKPYKEIISLYKQVNLAARIWNSNHQSYDRKPLVIFKRFFKNAIKRYGPVWDIANGLAYANLFKGI